MATIARGVFRETGRALVEQSRGFSSQIRGNLIPRDFASKVLQFQTFDKSTQDQTLLEQGLAPIVPSHVKIDRNADIIPQLVHIHCATLKNTNPSATQDLWTKEKEVGLPFYPLASDQHALVRVAVKYLNKPTAIIGVGTWNGAEIFQLLKAASASEKTRPLVTSVSMVDANPLAVKIAQISGHYLGLGSDRFISYQGNALEELPPVPEGEEYQQKMFIASRFLPVLTPSESSVFLQQIRGEIQDTDSHAVVSYSIRGQDDSKNEYFQWVAKVVDKGIFLVEELPDGIGFCLISNADRPENNLIKGGVFQTFLYEDRATEFFQKDGLNLVSSESSGRGKEGFTRHIGLLKNF